MNRTRLAAILSLFFCLYMIVRFVPLKVPLFMKDAYIIALFYPFIRKRHRVMFTFLYQLNLFYGLYLLLEQSRPTLSFTLTRALEAAITVEPEPTISWLTILINYHYAYYVAIQGVNILIISTLIIFEFGYITAFFTQPYSLYVIYQKLGFIKRIKDSFPHASYAWWHE